MSAVLATLLAAPPVAHIGHWLWCFYVIPVLIVIGGIAYTTRVGNRREKEEKKRR
jgi:hypothetical protein